jgi:hypothetical protein
MAAALSQRRSAAEWMLAAEAGGWVVLASLAIAVFPFRRVVALASSRRPRETPASGAEAARIAWAVQACARRAPWPALCFQQGLAAHWMLRRRGLRSDLHYGARHGEEGALEAHVWVRSGSADVVGCEMAASCGLLSTFRG